MDEALDFISGHNYGPAGFNVMLGDGSGKVVLIEKTHSHQVERYPEDGILIGVNIFRSPGMRPILDREHIPHIKDSILRMDRILEILEPHKGSIDRETLKAVLSDHENGENSICNHARRPTIVSYVYEPQCLKIHIAEGQPCQNEYSEFRP